MAEVALKSFGHWASAVAACPWRCRKIPTSVRPPTSTARRMATSYPSLTRHLLEGEGVSATIVELSGSVEIAPGLGTADAISDLVSTGTTLRANHLRELQVLFRSTAALYTCRCGNGR